MIEPIKRLNVTDGIVNQMKALILQGKLKQGDKLPPERELMNRFDVGRTSLREALKVLESQGLIERSKKGTIITSNYHQFFTDSLMYKLYFSVSEWEDIFEARLFIEKELTYLAAKRATKEDLAKINDTIETMKTAIDTNDQEVYLSANLQFHEKIAITSKNLVMCDLFHSISNLVSRVQENAVIVPGIKDDSLAFHQNIYEAIKQQDPEKASSLMADHVNSVHGHLKDKS